MNIIHYNLDYYVSLLREGFPFSFARYGDGEWRCILGDEGQTCDGQEYTQRLRDDLRLTLAEPRDYYYGLVRVAMLREGERVAEYVEQNNIGIDWVDGTVFADASRAGELYPLVAALRERRIHYVGPAHLDGALPFEVANFFEVPGSNAYAMKAEALIDALYNARAGDVVGYSAGPLSKVLIYYVGYCLNDVTLIDFGSLWDGFAGVYSRKYMRSPEWQALMGKNLEGK